MRPRDYYQVCTLQLLVTYNMYSILYMYEKLGLSEDFHSASVYYVFYLNLKKRE